LPLSTALEVLYFEHSVDNALAAPLRVIGNREDASNVWCQVENAGARLEMLQKHVQAPLEALKRKAVGLTVFAADSRAWK
jgi:hypothetical protein